jgi:hypothetical protein
MLKVTLPEARRNLAVQGQVMEMTSGGISQDGAAGQDSSSKETARYIADMTSGISALARKAGLDVLAYILDMARLEAEETAQKADPQ